MVARAALADDDAAGQDALAAVNLDAEPLALRITIVPTRALTFLMCHLYLALAVRSGSNRYAGRRFPSGSTTRGASAAGVNAAPAFGTSSSFLGGAGAAPAGSFIFEPR